MSIIIPGILCAPKSALGIVKLTPEAKIVVDFLSELEKLAVYPPEEKDFPKSLADKIKSGRIKILMKVGKPINNNRGQYDPQTNTLTVYVEKTGKLNLAEKEFLAHELYHAYQDLKKQHVSTWTDVEGPAYLLGLKCVLLEKGLQKPSDQAISVVLKHAEETFGWFMNADIRKMKQLISSALSSDPKEWLKGKKDAGVFQLKQMAFVQIDDYLMRVYKSGQSVAINFKLPGGSDLKIYRSDVAHLINLRLATQRGTANHKREAWIKLTKYWAEEVFVNETKFNAADKALLTQNPNGVN